MTTSRLADRMIAGAAGAAEMRLNTHAGRVQRAAELDAQADYYREQGDRETATDLRHQAQQLRREANGVHR